MSQPTIYVLELNDKYMWQSPFSHGIYWDEAKARKAYDEAVAWGKKNEDDSGHGYRSVTLWIHDWEIASKPRSEMDKRTQEARYEDGLVEKQWMME